MPYYNSNTMNNIGMGYNPFSRRSSVKNSNSNKNVTVEPCKTKTTCCDLCLMTFEFDKKKINEELNKGTIKCGTCPNKLCNTCFNTIKLCPFCRAKKAEMKKL